MKIMGARVAFRLGTAISAGFSTSPDELLISAESGVSRTLDGACGRRTTDALNFGAISGRLHGALSARRL